ncbi:MAG: tetratricopeptide repeat protein [Gammaproteobacteria bacterium]|nr:tetratricopeptide repeat protein [Gammaproteobacteria bacterium]
MFLKKLVIVSLCILCASCASERYTYESLANRFDHVYSGQDEYKMGYRYLLGQDTPKNYPKAISYFRKSANQDNKYAENELGYLYAAGKGVPQNYATAASWYGKAAAQNLASAQYSLGVLYAHGLGVSANKEKALGLFKQSAAQGFLPAQRVLQ